MCTQNCPKHSRTLVPGSIGTGLVPRNQNDSIRNFMISSKTYGDVFPASFASAETSVGVLATNFSKARFRVRSSIFGPVKVDCTIFFRIPIKIFLTEAMVSPYIISMSLAI